jgi:uncharacterized protein YlxW (UPF0749 family)
VSAPPKAQVESSSAALLIDLVNNTLDPGYAAAAARRTSTAAPRGRSLTRTLVALGCLLAGFILSVAYVSTHRAAPETATVHADLVSRARAAQQGADQLNRTAQNLTTTIDSLRNQALSGSGSLRSELQTAQVLAGATAVTGPGVLVSLANPPTAAPSSAAGRQGTTPLAATALLTDRDVRSVVNELWALGAEAISVNNVRLTPTSAIRFAGQAVLVDFEPINPPYLIRAIGNADHLDTGFAASDVAGRYQTLASVRGISFSFDTRDQLQLPGSTLSNLVHAHAVGATPSSSADPARSTPVSTGASK